MAAAVVQPLNPLVWLGAPALACMASAFLFTAPVSLGGVGLPQPVFGMICAFAWAAIRPSVLAPFLLLVMGVFDDLLWGTRLGLWATALLAAHALTLAARPVLIGQGPATLLGWFLGACAFGFAAAVALATMTAGELPDLGGLAIQFVATGMLFWLAWRLIHAYEDADVRFK